MADPIKDVTKAAKSAASFKTVLLFLFTFIVLNIMLDVIGGFFPIVPNIVMRPVTTVRAMFTKPAAA